MHHKTFEMAIHVLYSIFPHTYLFTTKLIFETFLTFFSSENSLLLKHSEKCHMFKAYCQKIPLDVNSTLFVKSPMLWLLISLICYRLIVHFYKSCFLVLFNVILWYPSISEYIQLDIFFGDKKLLFPGKICRVEMVHAIIYIFSLTK